MGSNAIKRQYREESLMKLLLKKKKLTTSEVSEFFNVSECTVRRLFDALESKGAVVRMYGGIRLPKVKSTDYHFDNIQFHQSEQKARIGAYAARLVESGDVFYLDTGTTVQQMAFALVRLIQDERLKDIQVYTNSLRNLEILKNFCEVNLIGGLYRDYRQDFSGYLAEMVLQTISFKKCFLSADGISLNPNDGIMATDIFTAKMNQALIKQAQRIYLMADSAKFIRRSFIKYASIENVNMIITDTDLPDEINRALVAYNVQVVQV